MKFFWDEINAAEIAAHGVDKATAEAVFFAITTAFQISRKRRRT